MHTVHEYIITLFDVLSKTHYHGLYAVRRASKCRQMILHRHT